MFLIREQDWNFNAAGLNQFIQFRLIRFLVEAVSDRDVVVN